VDIQRPMNLDPQWSGHAVRISPSMGKMFEC
jgi:hypothetical protein